MYEEQGCVVPSHLGYNDLREMYDPDSKQGLLEFIRVVMERQRISDN